MTMPTSLLATYLSIYLSTVLLSILYVQYGTHTLLRHIPHTDRQMDTCCCCYVLSVTESQRLEPIILRVMK